VGPTRPHLVCASSPSGFLCLEDVSNFDDFFVIGLDSDYLLLVAEEDEPDTCSS